MDALHWTLIGFSILFLIMWMKSMINGLKNEAFWIDESEYWHQKYYESRRIELEKNEDNDEEEYESFSHPRVESVNGNVIHVSFGGE